MAPDIMHDILEGVLQLSMAMLLKEFISNRKLFSLKTLNSRVTSFPYGPDAKNKPTPIKESAFTSDDNFMKQSGINDIQCLYMTYMYTYNSFTDMVFWKVSAPSHWWHDTRGWWVLGAFSTATKHPRLHIRSQNDTSYNRLPHHAHWRLLGRVQKAVPSSQPDSKNALFHTCAFLDDKVCNDYNSYTLYLHVNRFGPLIRLWCMRFEAKHSYFKQICNTIKNFKNLGLSLSYHHQRLMCYYMSDKTGYLSYTVTYGPGKCVYQWNYY